MSKLNGPIEIKDLKKSFGDLTVLDGVSFSIEPGEVLAFIGPSGSGKSTLLRCLNYLEKFSGEYIFEGRPAHHLQDKDYPKFRQNFGMVFQHFCLFPHMTALENICEAPVYVHGVDSLQAEKRAKDLLEQMGLGDRGNSYPSQLSGGQKQRVAIARSVATYPKVLLFDEPTSALDPEMVDEVLTAIEKLKEENFTMVIVSHEMGFIKNIADRVLFLDEGKIQEAGPSQDLFENPQSTRLKEFLTKVK